jgi:FMN phosphatase YigB (HAD superfamily)
LNNGRLPKGVTFDCAQTLLNVKWSPTACVTDVATRIDFPVTEDEAKLFAKLLGRARADYVSVNLTRDPSALQSFWRRRYEEWLTSIGRPISWATTFVAGAESLAYGEPFWFRPFSDVVPCLEGLSDLGIRLAVVSNWDISLHRVLRSLALDRYFETVIASLEEGPEKPDPRLFDIALARLQLEPNDVVHVGDLPIDDIEGATGAGIRAILLDRTHEHPEVPSISSLSQLLEAIQSNR